MIKRLYYNVDHGDRTNHSDSSSSDDDDGHDFDAAESSPSSQSDSLPQRPDGDEEEDDSSPNADVEDGSGYEREDGSGSEVPCDASGLPANDDDESIEEVKHQDEDNLPNSLGSKRKKENLFKNAKSMSEKHLPETQLDEYVLKCKSVFKCRLCPRIVCLNEDTLKTHLNSKRHARSKKLLNEGRLKLVLNSDGEIEEDEETHAERHARTMSLTQDIEKPKKRPKGRQRQRNRSKKKAKSNDPEERKTKQEAKPKTKKGRKV